MDSNFILYVNSIIIYHYYNINDKKIPILSIVTEKDYEKAQRFLWWKHLINYEELSFLNL